MPKPNVETAFADLQMLNPRVEFTFADLETPKPNVETAFADLQMLNPHVEFTFPDRETPNPNVEMAFPGASSVPRASCAGGSVVDGRSVSGRRGASRENRHI